MENKEAKEKAIELYYKYSNALNLSNINNIEKNPFAKQCAIIDVYHTFKEIDDNFDTITSMWRKLFWEEVKKEIQNL